jgi:hypothetical protein
MTKGSPQDLKDLAEDLKGCVQRHPDALKNNPDIQTDLVKVRDKAMGRYDKISEKKNATPSR